MKLHCEGCGIEVERPKQTIGKAKCSLCRTVRRQKAARDYLKTHKKNKKKYKKRVVDNRSLVKLKG